METLTCLEATQQRQISPFNYRLDDPGPYSAAPPSAQSSYCYKNRLRIGGVLGHCIHVKISSKASSENAQTTVSENRYTNPFIDVFRMVILSLLASTGNKTCGHHFSHTSYRIPPLHSCIIAECLHSFVSTLESPITYVVWWLLTYSMVYETAATIRKKCSQ